MKNLLMKSFFNSVLPSVRKMSEDDKFEFRLGVLNLIQSIKGHNKLQNPQALTNFNYSSFSKNNTCNFFRSSTDRNPN
jgi:hypothetical protein